MINSTYKHNIHLIAITSFVIMIATTGIATNAYASSFNSKDFKIKTFGIHDHTPFITVKGDAGGTKPTDHKTIYGYVFKTNDGVFGVVSHFGKDSKHQSGPNDTRYHAHKVTLDKNNCITSLKDVGKPSFSGHTVKLLDTHASKVNSVLTVKLDSSNSHHICVTKVFDSK
jgi:hypothetical protein